jgi:hypothetical protein
VLVLAPGVAEARFTTQGTARTTVGTLKLTGVTDVKTSLTCRLVFNSTYTVASFGEVPGARAYVLTLLSPQGAVRDTETVTNGSTPVTFTGPFLWSSPHSVTIQAKAGSWTGPIVEQPINCF